MTRFMLRLVAAMGLVLGSAFASAPAAHGQNDAAAAAQGFEAEAPAVTASDPLPAPDFARAYRHVFLAFAFAWVLIFCYAVFIDRRVARASEELERLG